MASQQIPQIPPENIIGEPTRKDVGPAVAFATGFIGKKFGDREPLFISWSDHLVKQIDKFQKILTVAEKQIQSGGSKIVFLGQKPRFPSVNLGYIHFGDKVLIIDGINIHSFVGFKYRPDKSLAARYFEDKKHSWNLGYFVTTPGYIKKSFKKFLPLVHDLTSEIISHLGEPNFDQIFLKLYNRMPQINFDQAILEQIDKADCSVIVEDIGWSDVGAWEALKEALEKEKSDNITNGRVFLENSKDNLIYNYEDKKLIVGIDLDDSLIINANDVLLVTKKSSVSKIKKLVESFQGTEHEKLT